MLHRFLGSNIAIVIDTFGDEHPIHPVARLARSMFRLDQAYCTCSFLLVDDKVGEYHVAGLCHAGIDDETARCSRDPDDPLVFIQWG